ncbi:putative alcohol dehydrogenase [Aspergillus flavus]|uniref:Probable quinone oxidoreductase n=1 Tax=Aspergillus flavus (strain ATCC 200026 / FGSC A1120 / IAM 13836 / NRRL 3357 / JCM 12722 / SRRC 167) TaxID=332952 RepID=A0A7U2MPY7_ASPFN|nr:uncharacterized protein G4B84_001444 [Aspergillus flavus NRRL3357]KAF7628126.1 hypothetical protein AFLA_003490 [Aspergillus flavus NRRL3357]QMW26199.1 hypothetical protein G4B84_001444 [Aspergillus flavus NRRL3357]QRD87726.1 putative alcohol dehydrogenase [Aspergillus flavus]
MSISLPPTMKGVQIRQQGDPANMVIETGLPLPTVKDTDVLVKLHYSGVNFIDIYQRTGVYGVQVPFTAGREGAGTIVQVGAKVTSSYGLKVGDRVAVFTQGAFAEYVAAPAEGVMRLPPSVSTKIGAAVMLQGLTAWTMVQESHKVSSGQIILVQAAAGGTGGLLVQMCKYLGATVIGTVSNVEKAKVAEENGCDHTILYKTTNVEEQVMRLTGNKGCHAVFSGVGQSTFNADLACTRRKGTLVSYGNSSGVVSNFSILLLSKKNVKLVRPTLANYIAEREEFVERSTQLLKLLEDGAIHMRLGGEYELEDVQKAQDALSGQKTMGKLLINLQA